MIGLVAETIKNKGYVVELTRLENCLNYICQKKFAYWAKYKRNKSLIVKFQSEWLNTCETILSEPLQAKVSSAERGRPKIDFAESSKRTKRRRIGLLENHDESAASVLRLSDTPPILKSCEPNIENVLSLLMETGIIKHQYLVIREFVNNEASCNILPRYEKILKLKKSRYPNDITVGETNAEVELQSLLDNAATSVLQLQNTVIENCLDGVEDNLTLIGKWGFDGSTGHSTSKSFPTVMTMIDVFLHRRTSHFSL